MRAALAAAAIGLAAPACAPEPKVLDELIQFSDARWCVPAEDFGRLLDSLLVPRQLGDDFVYVLGAPSTSPEYRDHVGPARLEKPGRDLFQASLSVRGTWRGLKVREVYVYGQPETDNQGMGIVFDAKPAQVIEAANQAGFKLPATGRRVEEDELSLTVAVLPDRGGAVLTCGT